MTIRAITAGLALAGALGLAANSASAASDYYGGVDISGIPVLWLYTPGAAPVGNKVKLCYPTGKTLGCTAPISAFTTAPGATDNLQYRLVPPDGSLWIVDLTAANTMAVLCEPTYNSGTSTFQIACTQGAGLK